MYVIIDLYIYIYNRIISIDMIGFVLRINKTYLCRQTRALGRTITLGSSWDHGSGTP